MFFLIFKLPLWIFRNFQNFENYFILEYFWFILGSEIFRYISLIEKKLQHFKNPYNLIFLTLIEKFALPANFQTAISWELIEQMTSNFQCFRFLLIWTKYPKLSEFWMGRLGNFWKFGSFDMEWPIYIHMGVSVYWPISVLLCACVCMCVISNQSISTLCIRPQ